jgi:hypothetical protein
MTVQALSTKFIWVQPAVAPAVARALVIVVGSTTVGLTDPATATLQVDAAIAPVMVMVPVLVAA